MSEKTLTLSGIYALGREKYQKMGWVRNFPPDSSPLASAQANRKILDSIFIEPHYFDPVEPDTTLTLLGVSLKTPVFCSALSRTPWLTDADMVDIARGLARTGSLFVLGIGGLDTMQAVVDTGVPTVKMVKPYRNTELIHQKVKEAESCGCIAVGMDIDHFYGSFRDGLSERADIFSPQPTAEIIQAISETKLPFIIKGILSPKDALRAADIGAAAVEVSNHGWAALDFSVPAVTALPRIADTVGKRIIILADSGLKTGNDVFKVLALGATAAGFASSILLAHAALGAEGVAQLITFLTAELKRTMAITGCQTVSAINRSLIVPAPGLML